MFHIEENKIYIKFVVQNFSFSLFLSITVAFLLHGVTFISFSSFPPLSFLPLFPALHQTLPEESEWRGEANEQINPEMEEEAEKRGEMCMGGGGGRCDVTHQACQRLKDD